MRRIVSLWLKNWPMDRWERSTAHRLGSSYNADSHPFALSISVQGAERLYSVNGAAEAAGLASTMTKADARAICPGLETSPAERAKDIDALAELAQWLTRYSPLVAIDSENAETSHIAWPFDAQEYGLFIDSTGCDHLFGGEEAMLADIIHRLTRAHIHVQAAIAPTPGAAWALAVTQPGTIVRTSMQQALAHLPVRTLRISSDSNAVLHRLGLKTIGSVARIPRGALARRFQREKSRHITQLLTRLDQMFTPGAEALSFISDPPAWRVHRCFEEPVTAQSQLSSSLHDLLEDLISRLEADSMGVRRLCMICYGVDGRLNRFTIGTSRASRDREHLWHLLDKKLEEITLDFGTDQLCLEALDVEPLADRQLSTTRHHAARAKETEAKLVDRLLDRLGPGAVYQLVHRASHIPERQQTYRVYGVDNNSWHDFQEKVPRPIKLLPQPEPVDVIAETPEGPPRQFRWRRILHRVTHSEGPERIAGEWWYQAMAGHDRNYPHAHPRDYFRVETRGGARLWLYREGLYEIAGVRPATPGLADPRWYMHGFFP